MSRVDVLFVAHAADRTGPPLALLRLLEAVRGEGELTVEVLLFRGGELLADFEALAPTTVIGEPVEPFDRSLPQRAAASLMNLRLLRAVPHLRRARLVYLNTSWSVRALHHLGPGGPSIVAHIHELDLNIGKLLPPADLERLRTRPDTYIVGTPPAAENLVDRHGVDPDRIHLSPYFIEPPEAPVGRRPEGVPDDAVLVGAAGVANWRKAPDLFVQMASRVLEQVDVPVHFTWMGGPLGGPADLCVPEDIKRLGLTGRVHFVGDRSDPWPWYAALDTIVMISREDTFPLVCLEAGSLGVPIVTFDVGGIPSMVEAADGGAVVPHLDVPAMAAEVAALATHDERRRRAGENLAEHVAREHGPSVGHDLARTIAELVP